VVLNELLIKRQFERKIFLLVFLKIVQVQNLKRKRKRTKKKKKKYNIIKYYIYRTNEINIKFGGNVIL